MTLQSIIRAGSVRQWHSNPDLCHTVDLLIAPPKPQPVQEGMDI